MDEINIKKENQNISLVEDVSGATVSNTAINESDDATLNMSQCESRSAAVLATNVTPQGECAAQSGSQCAVYVKAEPSVSNGDAHENTNLPPPNTGAVPKESVASEAENANTATEAGSLTVRVKPEPDAVHAATSTSSSANPQPTDSAGIEAPNVSAEGAANNSTQFDTEEIEKSLPLVRVKPEPVTEESHFGEHHAEATESEQTALNNDNNRTLLAPEMSKSASSQGKQTVVVLPAPLPVKSESQPEADTPTDAEDGRATPERPSMAAARALTAATTTTRSVKPEPQSAASETLPDDFFDDLLENAEELTAELTETLLPHSSPANVVAAPQIYNYDHSSGAGRRIKNELQQQIAAVQEAMDGDREDEALVGAEDASNLLDNDFFDDLLVDEVAARVARITHEAREIKYSEQLKSIKEKLRQLDEDDGLINADKSRSRSRGHKNKKSKSKKKSRKRERKEQELGVQEEQKERAVSGDSPQRNKRKRQHSTGERELIDSREIQTQQFNANYGNLNKVDTYFTRRGQTAATAATVADVNDANVELQLPQPTMLKVEEVAMPEELIECLPVQAPQECSIFSGFKKIKLEKAAVYAPTDELSVLTPALKRQKALQLAAEALRQLQGKQRKPLAGSLLYTAAVRKLPSSGSIVQQQIFEHRSPLHTINNVRYAFSSHSTRFNLHEWGLEALPPVAAAVARVIGYDADALFNRLQIVRRTRKYNKIKDDPDGGSEAVEVTKSSFFTNAMTQTDDVYVLSSRRHNAHDIGVQVLPMCSSIGTQTAAATTASTAYDDLPLMQSLKILNENQLLALNDFAELIREPASTAMDVYRLRTRMLEIYKCSQMPSVLDAASAVPLPHVLPHHVNATAHSGTMEFTPQQQHYAAFEQEQHLPQQQHYVAFDQQQQQHPPEQQKQTYAQYKEARAKRAQPAPQQQQPAFVIRDPRSLARAYVDPRQNAVALGAPQKQSAAKRSALHTEASQTASAAPAAPKGYGRGSTRR